MKAIWRWLCSADKRPYFELGFDDLIEIAKKASPSDIKTLQKIKEELSYRKRVRSKKKEILTTILEQHYVARRYESQVLVGNADIKEKDLSVGIEPESSLADAAIAQWESIEDESVQEDELNEALKNQEYEPPGGIDSYKTFQIIPEIDIATNTRLSIRTKNALLRNGFTTLSELQGLDDDEILCLKNIGEQALAEIKLYLAQDSESSNAARDTTQGAELTEIIHATLASCLMINNRVITALYRNGITSLDTLLSMSRADLYGLDGIGDAAVETICSALEVHGLSLSVNNEQKPEIETYREEGDEYYISAILENDAFREKQDIAQLWLQLLPSRTISIVAQYAMRKPADLILLLERLEGKTLQEIGDRCGITRERVRQKTSKVEKAIGMNIEEMRGLIESHLQSRRELALVNAMDKDLLEKGALSTNWAKEWQSLYCAEPTILDRVNTFRRYCIPPTVQEINEHLDVITLGVGNYGGNEYWTDDNLRNLIWAVSNRVGSPGKMPKQVELPRLVSRYVQRRGGQRQVAQMYGFQYDGPVGTRNRSYWTGTRISAAINDTQKYFCLPQRMMPEQCQINFYLEIDDDEMTKGPSCLAAIKRDCSWEEFCQKNHLVQYELVTAEERKQIDWEIIETFWNREIPFSDREDYLDRFTTFMNQFWNAPAQPLKYKSLVEKAREVGHLIQANILIGDKTMPLEQVKGHEEMSSDNNEEDDDLDRFVDLLF